MLCLGTAFSSFPFLDPPPTLAPPPPVLGGEGGGGGASESSLSLAPPALRSPRGMFAEVIKHSAGCWLTSDMMSPDESPTASPSRLEGWLRLQRGLPCPGSRLTHRPVAGKRWPAFPAPQELLSRERNCGAGTRSALQTGTRRAQLCLPCGRSLPLPNSILLTLTFFQGEGLLPSPDLLSKLVVKPPPKRPWAPIGR